MTRRNMVSTMIGTALTFTGAAFAMDKDNNALPRNTGEMTLENVKDLLLQMDTDKNGMVSKQEWMNFMSAEFDRLDKDKSGELNTKELMASRIRPVPSQVFGK